MDSGKSVASTAWCLLEWLAWPASMIPRSSVKYAERYCWPSELDLMAGQAGLRLGERYAGWDRRPFGSDSRDHISVYRPG
jgi:hypothetical protein